MHPPPHTADLTAYPGLGQNIQHAQGIRLQPGGASVFQGERHQRGPSESNQTPQETLKNNVPNENSDITRGLAETIADGINMTAG